MRDPEKTPEDQEGFVPITPGELRELQRFNESRKTKMERPEHLIESVGDAIKRIRETARATERVRYDDLENFENRRQEELGRIEPPQFEYRRHGIFGGIRFIDEKASYHMRTFPMKLEEARSILEQTEAYKAEWDNLSDPEKKERLRRVLELRWQPQDIEGLRAYEGVGAYELVPGRREQWDDTGIRLWGRHFEHQIASIRDYIRQTEGGGTFTSEQFSSNVVREFSKKKGFSRIFKRGK